MNTTRTVPDGAIHPDRSERSWPIIAREGWPIVAGFALVSMGLTILGAWLHPIAGSLVGVVTGLLTIWCIWFFRDPARRIPEGPNLVISPADGVVVSVARVAPPTELGFDESTARVMTRISIFMNVFNVHVNRCPARATVERVHARPGRYFNASLDKASEHNERCGLVLRLPDGRLMACVQIAGLIARRIICRVKPGTALGAGERYGLIRFGSRVDVYLPAGVEALVRVGERSVAGETILARLDGAEGGQQ